MVEVTPGDIRLAEGNPDAVFTAIHPDFYAAEAPYLLTSVEVPTKASSDLQPKDHPEAPS
jgi:hypothetical protein